MATKSEQERTEKTTIRTTKRSHNEPTHKAPPALRPVLTLLAPLSVAITLTWGTSTEGRLGWVVAMSISPTSASGTATPVAHSSADGVGVLTADLSIKYHKLATEYAKLRAQFAVVKKAVIDEQAKTADLNAIIRQKEVAERKWEAETDSLNFRNQQLTKRIEMLQSELEHMQQVQGKRKGTSKENKMSSLNPPSVDDALNSVVGQELQSKIEENAKLHARLADIDNTHNEVVGDLKSRIHDLEAQVRTLERCQRDLERTETDQEKVLALLETSLPWRQHLP